MDTPPTAETPADAPRIERRSTPPLEKPSWSNRRRAIFSTLYVDHGVLLFSCIAMYHLAMSSMLDFWSTTVLGILIVGSLGRTVLVIGSYVFGAAWDDKNFMQTLSVLGNRVGGSPPPSKGG